MGAFLFFCLNLDLSDHLDYGILIINYFIDILLILVIPLIRQIQIQTKKSAKPAGQ